MSDRESFKKHIPVLQQEVLGYLIPECGSCQVIDGTLGYGGHSSLILRKNQQAELLGIDRDGDALAEAEEVLSFASNRIHLVRGEFGSLAEHAEELGWSCVDAILLDVGISSVQIDDPRRGFSIRKDGPLDMRMDRRSPNTASRLLNNASKEYLAEIFKKYGEIRKSRKLAAAIVSAREEKPFTRTSELVELCDKILGSGSRLPAATLCFQALRIAVNGELEQLEKALEGAVDLLKPGGRIGIISFHSLEDRIVKNFFRGKAVDCICPPGPPVCICDNKATLKIITRKPITAGKGELEMNRRASSAKLRVAERKGE